MELGGVAAIDGAVDHADGLRAKGSFADAVAEYRAVAARSGPLYLLVGARIAGAGVAAQRTELDWARALAAAGNVDEALVLAGRVDDPSLVGEARRTGAQIALDGARAAASTGQFDLALQRLNQLTSASPPADLAATAAALRPPYALGAAQLLLDQGRPEEAVAALDAVLASTDDGAVTQARALLPRALMEAGRAALQRHDQAAALRWLTRLTEEFSASPEAGAARALLRAPQPVTGALRHRLSGTPAAGIRVRLGSHFSRVGTGYMTTAPFYFARTDADGNFTINGVPVGADLVLEVLANNSWTTIITDDPDPARQVPAYRVTVTPLTPVDLAYVIIP